MKDKTKKTLQQLIEKVICDTKKERPATQGEDLQYVDFNKSIEKMLTAKNEEKLATENILSL